MVYATTLVVVPRIMLPMCRFLFVHGIWFYMPNLQYFLYPMSLFAHFFRYTFELVQEIECLTYKKKLVKNIKLFTKQRDSIIPL